MRREPTFSANGVELYLADSAVVVPELAEVDLLVTDPPYGVEYRSNFRTKRLDVMQGDGCGEEDRAKVAAILLDSVLRLRRKRHVYVFGPPEPVRAIGRLTAHATLIWDKVIVGMGDLSMPRGPSHETINFAVHNMSKSNQESGYGHLAARMRQGSVVRSARPNSLAVRHPSEKPVAVMRQLVESSSCLGELVLDPFMGSGATVVAALLTGRRAIGIEKDPKHFEVARGRVEALLPLLDRLESA